MLFVGGEMERTGLYDAGPWREGDIGCDMEYR